MSDWYHRPLSPEQLSYAINDVIYLKPLMEKLYHELENVNRLQWFIEECKQFENCEYYDDNILNVLSESHWIHDISLEEKAFLLKLIEWREIEAKRLNQPVINILKLKDIKQIIEHFPDELNELESVKFFPSKILRKHKSRFINIFNST